MDVTSKKISLDKTWKKFITTGSINGNVREIIKESWLRCKKFGINPNVYNTTNTNGTEKLKKELSSFKYLVETADPIMKDLYSFVKGSGFLISLANNKGKILNVVGDDKIIKNSDVCNGDSWDEKDRGTNSIALCLRYQKPIQVFASEHYCKPAHDWTCSSAPIFDNNQKIIGILTMTGKYDKVHLHTLGMVVAGANAITSNLHLQKSLNEVTISDAFKSAMLETIDEGIIAIDVKRTISQINTAAINLLKLKQPKKNIISQPFNKVLKNNLIAAEIENCFHGINNKTFQIEGEDFSITHSFIYSENKKVIGLLFVLKEIKQVRKFVNNFLGNKAAYNFKDLIGNSAIFNSTIKLAKIGASSISNILLVGESGTGKEMFAQAIHNNSNRKYGPFLAVNCAALPRNLIESELFGYAEGAFTGAKKGGNPGKFELADGGTLFLDEIAEMPLEFQAMLLRVLQERSVTRIGGGKPIPIDVRIISATNKNLEEEVDKGNFRDDLYYRLNVFKINIPSLRERPEDIVLLTEHFIKKLNRRLNKNVEKISKEALDILSNYDWPGNVRELQNVLERIINIKNDNVITVSDLPNHLLPTFTQPNKKIVAQSLLKNYEKELILTLINKNKGNKSKVAQDLGISRTTLYRRLYEYNIK